MRMQELKKEIYKLVPNEFCADVGKCIRVCVHLQVINYHSCEMKPA